MPVSPTFNPSRTFLYVARNGAAERLNTSEKGFWRTLADRQLDGLLVGVARLTRNTQWEMHPDGDELLFLLRGALEVVLDHADAEETFPLAEGRMAIVPQGVWHRQLVKQPLELLFATPGPSTQRCSVREYRALRSRAGVADEAIDERRSS
jgi:mannose-6-phosphate isomerase-like protein (cupin superfamily)